jgi:hypothetical protein
MNRRGVDEEILARDEALRQLEKASIRRHKVLKKKLDEKIDNVRPVRCDNNCCRR